MLVITAQEMFIRIKNLAGSVGNVTPAPENMNTFLCNEYFHFVSKTSTLHIVISPTANRKLIG